MRSSPEPFDGTTSGWSSIVPGIPAEPAVPGWVRADPRTARAAAARLGETAAALRTVTRLTGGLLVDAAQTMGWRCGAATAAQARAGRAGSRFTQAASCCDDAASALSDLARQIAWRRWEIERLRRRRTATIDRAILGSRYAATGVTPPRDAMNPAELPGAVAGVDGELRAHLDALAAADAGATSGLERAGNALRRLAAASDSDAWITSVAIPGAAGVLSRYGVVPSAAEQALLDRVVLMSTQQAAAFLRRELSGREPAAIEALLLRNPHLAELLAGPPGPEYGRMPGWADLPTASAATALAGVLVAGRASPPKERICAVRRHFAALPPREARRLALLYPAVVGNLDGAPLPERIAANRIGVAAALSGERRRLVGLEQAVAGQTPRQAWWSGANDVLDLLVDISDAPARLAQAQARIDLYDRLLHEQVPNPAPAPGRPDTLPHQVLLFDPTGDGRIAQLQGVIDDQTRHVAVFVPGTGSELANFSGYAEMMSRVVRADRAGTTAAVAWLGTDLPDAVVADAPDPAYADSGGSALRDFQRGLDVPGAADSTVIGHSYGGALVGVADRAGLVADRVVHVESAGAGRGVFDVDDYGRPERKIDRYTMTAPGDPIVAARLPSESQQERFGVGHGGDPDTMAGFTRLETGRFNDDKPNPGAMISGLESHSQVLTERSTAWNNMVQVVIGGEVTLYTHPDVMDRGLHRYPYADSRFTGPKADIP